MEQRADQGPGRSGRITLLLTGDVMTGRGIDQVLPHPGDPRLNESFIKSAVGYVELAEEANGPIPGRAPTRPLPFGRPPNSAR